MHQQDLFSAIEASYLAAPHAKLDNAALYSELSHRLNLSPEQIHARQPIGIKGEMHSPVKRAVRWYQQSLKMRGLLERDGSCRGAWSLTSAGKTTLKLAAPGAHQVAFSTALGIAIWGSSPSALYDFDQPVMLCVTSPPYPDTDRAYGRIEMRDYIDFVCNAIAPIVASLAPGGSLCLNVGNNVYKRGSPARTSYWWRLGIEIQDRFGLDVMDTLIWENTSAPPGPLQWSSKSRQQLNQTYEPVLWFTNDAKLCEANNQRVLQPHTDKQRKLIEQGGERRGDVSYADGAYRNPSFRNATDGAIPRNVLRISHSCAGQRRYKALARAAGLPVHGAPFPERLARFLVSFLTDIGHLVVDPFGGSMTVPAVCEQLGRLWCSADSAWEYCASGGLRLMAAGAPGFRWGHAFRGDWDERHVM